jgi:hypothetical protein
MDIVGVDGQRLKDKWVGGPKTYLGVLVSGFPNMLMAMGPHTALGNFPRSIESNVEWLTDLIAYAREKGYSWVEATAKEEAAWTDHVKHCSDGLLVNDVDSWLTGINSNVDGKQTRTVMIYNGSAVDYRARCDEVAKAGYKEVTLLE